MGTTDHGSGATTATRSGRRVAHSRGGCLTCKRRRLRCPENKPICERCWNDNKPCSYALQLQWEDDSRKRGIKHGRGSSSTRADMTSSWVGLPIASRVRHFLNTSVWDIEGEIPTTVSSSAYRVWSQRPTLSSWPRAIPTLSVEDGRDAYLFDYYWQCVCKNMTLVDGSFNTFRQLILPLALSSESVMHMVLALGALSLNAAAAAAGRNDHCLYTVALRHKHRSMQQLRRHIAQAETAANDQNLIVILMLCVFDISDNCQLSWSTHLCAAIDLMRLASTQLAGTSMITPEVSSFVSRFFLVKDALGRTACGKRAKIKQLPSVNSAEIDPTIGCSYELIDIISAITDLSREMTQDPTLTASAAWLEKTAQIERHLESLTQYLPSSISNTPSSSSCSLSSSDSKDHLSDTDILHHTSNLIHTSAKLYFLATLRSIDPYDPQARQLVRDAIEWARPLSPRHLRSAHLWPLFVAAVYATHDEERVFFLDQFDLLLLAEGHQSGALVAAGSVGRVREIVETVWKRRDLRSNHSGGGSTNIRYYIPPTMGMDMDTNSDADEKEKTCTVACTSPSPRPSIPAPVPIVNNDWARYVQPMSEGLCLG